MNLSEFLPDIYLEAPGCPEAVALNALRHTIRDFCERTRAWQAVIDPIDLIAGQPSYDIDVPHGAELMLVLSATYDGMTIPIYAPEEMDKARPSWRDETGTGVSKLIQDWNTLFVNPTPTADDDVQIEIRAAFKPTLSATTCGDILGNWHEGIAGGAISRLKSIPGKPWTDREGVSYYKGVYADSVANASIKTLTGFSRQSKQVRARSFV